MNYCPAEISRLELGSPSLAICANWRHEAFGIPLPDSFRQLEELAARQDYEITLIAELGEYPAGICMFVRQELEFAHELSPWLASLYVVPAFRKNGIGRALVKAIEDYARNIGENRLHLYTIDADRFYLKCGWVQSERFEQGGETTVLMHRNL